MAAKKKPRTKTSARPRKKPKAAYHHPDLRTALLTAAIEVLRERGAPGLSLRECARRAGVSHAAPYRHFPDKDALLRAIAMQGFAWLTAAGREAMAGHEEPRARLDAYGVAYVRFAIAHPEHHRIMFTSQFEIPPDSTDTDGGAFDLLVEASEAVVREGEDALAAAFAFWSLVHGISMLILDGRVPEEYLGDIEGLVRGSFAYWRG